jgi:excisionase family DNA binding protein
LLRVSLLFAVALIAALVVLLARM